MQYAGVFGELPRKEPGASQGNPQDCLKLAGKVCVAISFQFPSHKNGKWKQRLGAGPKALRMFTSELQGHRIVGFFKELAEFLGRCLGLLGSDKQSFPFVLLQQALCFGTGDQLAHIAGTAPVGFR